MNKFSYLLFDFDGTLFDTAPGIFKSMQHVCDHYKLPYGEAEFKKMIGPSLKESFTTIFHLPESEVPQAINVYREYYSTVGMFDCTPYNGVFELIEKLRTKGFKILVATSKPELYAKQILERKGFLHLFDFVGGADLSEQKRCEKIDVVNYVLKENNLVKKKNECLMIGDRKYDINGAHAADLKALGILWGFGNREEFEEANADFILETPEQVFKFLSN